MKQMFSLVLLVILITSCEGQNSTHPADKAGSKAIPAGAVKIYDHGADTFLMPGVMQIDVRTASVMPAVNARCGVMDRNGDLWFCTWDGIYRYNGKDFTVYTERDIAPDPLMANGYGPPAPNRVHSILNRVYSVIQDRTGKLWFSSPNGFCCFDGKSFTNFPIPDAAGSKDYYPHGVSWDLNQLSAKCVVGIYEDRRGNIWFGTWGGGAYRYDGTSLTNFSEKDGLCLNVIQAFYEDKAGNYWFGSRGGGMCFYDGKTFTRVKMKEGDSDGHFFQILEDKKGNLWFSTRREGVYCYDGTSRRDSTASFTSYFGNIAVAGITEDRKGNLWFGSNDFGVYCYDGKKTINLTTKEGLCNNSVWFILEDKSGNLWFGTREGLDRYDGKTFTSFTAKK